jgi:hypothetical protein
VSLGGALHLAAIAALTLAVIALSLDYDVAATVLFVGAAAAFLVTIVLQRRR